MKIWPLLGTCVLLAACTTKPAPVTAAAAPSPAVAAAPASLPIVPIASRSRGQLDEPTQGTPERVVLESKAEFEAFLARHGSKPPRVETMPPPPEGLKWPVSLSNLDFDRYQLAAIVTDDAPAGSSFRVVAVEDQADARLIRTTSWQKAGGTPGRDFSIIAVARGSKPLKFAPTEVTQAPFSFKAVPNPELTQAFVEAATRMKYPQATKLKVSQMTLSECATKFGSTFSPGIGYSLDSLAWVVEVEGNVDAGLPHGVGGSTRTYTFAREINALDDFSPIEVTNG